MTILFKISALLIIFLVGQLSYDTIYLWTLETISYLTNGKIHFLGKLWDFLGKPSFGFVILLLPIVGYSGIKRLNVTGQFNLLKYWTIDALLISLTYFFVCYFYGQYLLSQILKGKIQSNNYHIHLNNVNLFVTVTLTILAGSLLTFIIFQFRLKKNAK